MKYCVKWCEQLMVISVKTRKKVKKKKTKRVHPVYCILEYNYCLFIGYSFFNLYTKKQLFSNVYV